MTDTLRSPDPLDWPRRSEAPGTGPLALVMSGGGARAAYQAGFFQGLSERVPELEVPILTGVSAGAINAAFLAQAPGTFAQRSERLVELWRGIETDDVLDTRPFELMRLVLGWGLRLVSGGRFRRSRQGFVETDPLDVTLRTHLRADAEGKLPGVAERIADGSLRALAITGSCYESGQSVTWVEGAKIVNWERPTRVSIAGPVSVEHVMASAALPILFPPVLVGGTWFGDGGIRLTAPLSPAVHLGADRLLAISTRFAGGKDGACIERARADAAEDPPPAQIAGTLLNAVFLDLVDQDALNLARINHLIAKLPDDQRAGLRPIELAVVRPSQDLGKLANEYEARLPRGLRFLTRGWGTKQTRSNDLLSLLMFQRDYLERLVELGIADAAKVGEDLVPFLEPSPA